MYKYNIIFDSFANYNSLQLYNKSYLFYLTVIIDYPHFGCVNACIKFAIIMMIIIAWNYDM